MKNQCCLLWISLFMFSFHLYAQDYKEQAESIRTEVWQWQIPAFSNYEVPEHYQNESAIIIAQHRQIEATGKMVSKFRKMFTGDASNKVFYTDINRVMVKINDQAALNVYSDFSFREQARNQLGIYSDRLRIIMGTRIIKPDGQIREIDVDSEAVTLTQGKNENDDYKKIAIPDLQVGDILDYFVCNVYELQTMNMKDQYITFYSTRYPTLYSSVHCEFGENLTVEYRSLNGAPEFERQTDESGNAILDAVSTNIPYYPNLKDESWFSYFREMPLIRISTSQYLRLAFTPASARPPGLHKNVSHDIIIDDAIGYLAEVRKWLHIVTPRNADKLLQKKIDKYKQANPSVNELDLALRIAYLFKLYWNEKKERDEATETAAYVLRLNQILKNNGIESKIGFLTSRLGPRREELFDKADLYYVVTANDDQQLFFPRQYLHVEGEIPGALEGEIVDLFNITKFKSPVFSNTPPSFEGTKSEKMVPITTPEKHRSTVDLSVRFSEESPLVLLLDRKSELSGEVKREIQPVLFIFEDWDQEIRRYMEIRETYLEEAAEDKKTRKRLDEVKTIFEEQRQNQAALMEKEVFQYHGFAPVEVFNFDIMHLGVTPDEPMLKYNISYSVDNLVKKAGDNLILEVGKLIGAQWTPTEMQRKRDFDVYLPSSRIFENNISITIPPGYTVQLPDAQTYTTDNRYGTFQASLSLDQNILNIHTSKIYKESFIPVEDFPLFLEMMDKANEFFSMSIVLTN